MRDVEEKLIGNMRCLIRYPENFDENEKHPLLFFLHGAGTRGNDINNVANNPFFKIISMHKVFPFVVIAPLCTENTWFDMFERLEKMVKEAAAYSYVDADRVYMIGASMGGYGTWQLAMSLPDYFAAIVPICGGGMYWNAARLHDVPAWAFHGALDKTVLLEESEKMVNAVNAKGGNAKLTVYPENHHDAWSDTYKNIEVFNWLLSHKRGNKNDVADEYNKSDIYG